MLYILLHSSKEAVCSDDGIWFTLYWFFVLLIVSAADPGVVRTNIMREVPSSLRCVAYIVLRLMGLLQSPEDGINSVIDAALAPPVNFPC